MTEPIDETNNSSGMEPMVGGRYVLPKQEPMIGGLRGKELKEEGDWELYQNIRKIADLAYEYISPESYSNRPEGMPGMEDWRKESVNPFYHQTERGLYLEFYYGMPNRLWTPWGEWHFGGSGSGHFDEAAQKILERLGAKIHQPERHTNMGVIGPVYSVHRVDGIQLSEPKEKDKSQYMSYEESKKSWEELTERYLTAQESSK